MLSGGFIYWRQTKDKRTQSGEKDSYCVDESTGLEYACNQIIFTTADEGKAEQIAQEYGAEMFFREPDIKSYGIEFSETKSSEELEKIIREMMKKYDVSASLNIIMRPSS